MKRKIQKYQFIINLLICLGLTFIFSSCEKSGHCYCYTDIQGLRWIDDSFTTKQECKKESNRRQSMDMGDYCKWK